MKKKIALILIGVAMLLSLAGCSKKCANNCGENADSECMAEMCDDCCDYWMGLNGCRAKH